MKELAGYGAGALAQQGELMGTEVEGVEVSFTIGLPPHEATVLRGGTTDPDTFERSLLKLGATQGEVAGREGFVWGDEGENHLDFGSGFNVGASGEFNRSILSEGEIVTGRYEAEVAALVGEGEGATLAEDEVYAGYLACLGDVVAAVGAETSEGVYAAAGVRLPGDKPATEVVCAVGGDQAQLESSLKRFDDPDFLLPSTRQPVSDLFSEVTVERGEGFVRMTVVDAADRAPGITLEALLRREFF